jgi:polysaccharide biosynthesis/export protein
MLNKFSRFFLSVILTSFLFSCVDTRKTTYFNDVADTVIIPSDSDRVSPVVQKNDILNISITSLNIEASAPFNLTSNSPNSISTVSSAGSSQTGTGYLVNSDGYIQMPMLGDIKVAGFTTKELKGVISNLLVEKKLLKDPIVIIRHLNYEITVIGEVGRPGVINVPSEKISLLKAIGLAGDISIYGRKDNVLLIREVNGKRTVKRINLESAAFLTSPNYYLQPNDVVYVEANKNKVSNASAVRQALPVVLSGISIVLLALDRIIK